ncbi:hypothetical protein, partial [Haladaptatus sp.]|uniref:hypothetical protein n=1 Tax=Haladaptatus sp. TaxID=1973141 RepID=UPI003C334498
DLWSRPVHENSGRWRSLRHPSHGSDEAARMTAILATSSARAIPSDGLRDTTQPPWHAKEA